MPFDKTALNCEWCKEETEILDSHHLIPLWIGGTDEDVMNVCRKCEFLGDEYMCTLIVWKTGTPRLIYSIPEPCGEFSEEDDFGVCDKQ